MNAIFAKILYELEKQHDLVLITIISNNGSAPRGVGAQMLVGAQGRILGTIGGGPAEWEAEQTALQVLREKCSRVQTYSLYRGGNIGSVCGGEVTALLQYIRGDDAVWAEAAGTVISQIAAHETGWLVQRINGDAPTLLNAEGCVLAGDDIGQKEPLMRAVSVLENGYFSVPLPVGERVVIFGAGHCALALAPLLRTVGFRVTVFDDRPEWVNSENYPCAETLICGDFQNISAELELNEKDYVVVMTSGHSNDFAVQEQVLRKPLAYIGVIGSRSKTAFVNQRLREAGIDEAAIQSVHTPIGTAIKAVTPEEIAVSIAGEMIYERALRREAAEVIAHGCPMH